MKTTLNLLNEVTEMGFDRDKALEEIDVCIDELFTRKPIEEEYLPDDVYEDILQGFIDEKSMIDLNKVVD